MDSFLMATMLKPALSISERMAAVALLRTASGLMMLNVRCDTRNLLLEGEFFSLFIVGASSERPPPPKAREAGPDFHSPGARYSRKNGWPQCADFRHVMGFFRKPKS